MARQKNPQGGKVFCRLLFVLYCLLMLWLLFGQRWDTVDYSARHWNLKAFSTVTMYWNLLKSNASAYHIRQAFINLAGNVVMFVPLGYFLPRLFGKMKPLWKTMLMSCFLIVAVELTQYFTYLGTCDIDDLILNLVGCLLGWLLWRIKRR